MRLLFVSTQSVPHSFLSESCISRYSWIKLEFWATHCVGLHESVTFGLVFEEVRRCEPFLVKLLITQSYTESCAKVRKLLRTHEWAGRATL